MEEELDEIPIVQEFKQSQVDVNDLLQMVASQVSNKVTDLIIESTDGDLLRGETGSKVKQAAEAVRNNDVIILINSERRHHQMSKIMTFVVWSDRFVFK